MRILTALQRNARTSNVELSSIAQITPPTALRRRQTLEKNGIIHGYHAELDVEKLGFEVLAFVFVGLTSQSDRNFQKFERAVQLWPAVRECYSLTGEIDFLLKCVAENLTALRNFVEDQVMREPGVRTVRTVFSSRIAKHEPDVQLTRVSAPLAGIASEIPVSARSS
jgi:DNA-binding Lrp family transcriptional regulator